MLSGLVDNCEDVMAEGTNPQKKHLLRRLVKKVLVHDRRKVEVWYGLPNPSSVISVLPFHNLSCGQWFRPDSVPWTRKVKAPVG